MATFKGRSVEGEREARRIGKERLWSESDERGGGGGAGVGGEVQVRTAGRGSRRTEVVVGAERREGVREGEGPERLR